MIPHLKGLFYFSFLSKYWKGHHSWHRHYCTQLELWTWMSPLLAQPCTTLNRLVPKYHLLFQHAPRPFQTVVCVRIQIAMVHQSVSIALANLLWKTAHLQKIMMPAQVKVKLHIKGILISVVNMNLKIKMISHIKPVIWATLLISYFC